MKIAKLLAGVVGCGIGAAAFGQTNLIVDGGFETPNPGAWQISAQTPGILYNPNVAYDGYYYLALGGNSFAQTVFQTVTLPTNTVAAALSYFINIYSSTLSASDYMESLIVYPNNSLAATVDTETGANSAGAEGPGYYEQVSYNLSNWIGQTIEIEFVAQASPETVFNIDDVAVWVETTADIPPNDYFTNRIALTGTSVRLQATNTFATTETGEPDIKHNAPSHSLWWSWTAESNGTVTLSTSGSSFANMLAVYTGTELTNLTQVAAAVSVAESGNPAQVTFPVAASGQYQIAVDGYGGAFGILELALNFKLDTQPPSVSFSSPAANATVTNSTVVVQGTAKDNVAVGAVEYRLENATGTNAYQAATGTTNWTATVTGLVPGLNTVEVFAIDTSSNLSKPTSRSFTYVVVVPLALTTNGEGTLKGKNFSGTNLDLGKPYSITAVPVNGNLFVDWTDGSGKVLTNGATYSFTMKAGLTLVANFVPNPFLDLAGNYTGLFGDTNRFSPSSAGSFSGKLTTLGGLTAQLGLAGTTYHLSGTVSPYGVFSQSIAGPGGEALDFQLQLDLSGKKGLTGTVSNSSWSALLTAYLPQPAADLTSGGKNYTLVIPGAADPAIAPGGFGFGTVSVSSSGAIKYSVTLGDGNTVSGGSVVVGSGQWPLSLSPTVSAGKELAWGWLSFPTNAGSVEVAGQVSWVKESGTRAPYPNGFVFSGGLPVMESVYTLQTPVVDWTGGQGYIGLSSGQTNAVTLGANNKFSPVGKSKLSLTLTPASGQFKGTVPVGGAASAGITVNGVLLQGTNGGFGLFLTATNSGSVFLGSE